MKTITTLCEEIKVKEFLFPPVKQNFLLPTTVAYFIFKRNDSFSLISLYLFIIFIFVYCFYIPLFPHIVSLFHS